VRVLFDTSVIVPALINVHPNHATCFPWLRQAETGQIAGLISTHSLAESYSVMTRLPIVPKVSVQQAERALFDLLSFMETVALERADYQSTIARLVRLNLPGGIIFDALIAQAAQKANADVLLTRNAKDFTRLGEEIAAIVQVPS
jgi:predicted nucleic acid-binding protein